MRKELRDAWHDSGWLARCAVIAFAALFVIRATHAGGPPTDRNGFIEIARPVISGGATEHLLNTYPPTATLLYVSLAKLQDLAGELPLRLAWGFAQLAALAVLTLGGARLLRVRLELGGVALAWLCAWRAVVGDLNNQNVSLLLYALVVAALLAASSRPLLGSALLGVGGAIKVWPAFAVMPLLAGTRRRLHVLVGAGLGLLVVLAATWGYLGTARLVRAFEWWLFVIPRAAGGNGLMNQAWGGFFQRALGGLGLDEIGWSMIRTTDTPGMQLGRTVARVVGAIPPLVVLALAAVRRPASDRVARLDAILFVLGAVALLPFTWTHYYVAVIPIVLGIIGSRATLTSPLRGWIWGLLAAAAALAQLDFDVVGVRAYRLAAFAGAGLWSAMLVLASGVLLRIAWDREDLAQKPENSAR